MHQPVAEQGTWLALFITGYFAYHALLGNRQALEAFRTQCTRLWYKTLCQHSQKSKLTWTRMHKLAEAWLPLARILHPWPEQRLAVFIQGKSRVR
jgi:RNA-directed DNA polymerase